MSTGRPPAPQPVPISLEPTEGWHCTHLYYRFDRGVLAQLSADELRAGARRSCSRSSTRPAQMRRSGCKRASSAATRPISA